MISWSRKMSESEASDAGPCKASAWGSKRLSQAIAGKELVPYFQPKLDLCSNRVTGVEVLARWNHPEHGQLLPADFITELEGCGLAVDLFAHLLEESLSSARSWIRPINIAVNVPQSAMTDDALVAVAHGICVAFDTAPSLVTIEVTEGDQAQDSSAMLRSAMRFRELGFHLSIDDFGTGFSSLLTLRQMPFNELKIDRQLVTAAMHREKHVRILESVTSLCRDLGLRIVAEGISNEEEKQFVQSLGCHMGQGFSIAQPMSQEQLGSFLRQEESHDKRQAHCAPAYLGRRPLWNC